jgi:glycosyltransferase involved in cell wall biosynthesis
MKVSIVIPCYNCADFIQDSVRSAYEQVHEDTEVICIDNNSSDDTWAVLNSLRQEYPTLSIDKELKPGAPAARNKGWKMAKGEWIQFLDADDLLKSQKISAQITHATEHVSILIGDYLRHELGTGLKEEVLADRKPWRGLINNRLGITSSNLFRKIALQEVSGFDERLKSSQEYDLMFRIMKNHDIAYTEGVYTEIRSRAEGSISKTDLGGNKHRYLQLTRRIAAHLKATEIEVYSALGEAWYQDMFIRIRMNAIDGFPDSGEMFEAILPKGFKAEARPFTPSWFRFLMQVVGYANAEKLRALISK